MNIEFSTEVNMTNMTDALSMIKTVWDEVPFCKKGQIKFKPDVQHFVNLMNSGILFLITARDISKNNEVVAVYASIIAPNMFNTEIKTSHTIGWGVKKVYRSKGLTKMLLDQIETTLVANKIHMWNLVLPKKEEPTSTEKLLTTMGYELVESTYMRYV